MLIYTQITIFIVPPIGAVPEGKTVIITRLNKTEFIDSPDAMCERMQGGVSLLCAVEWFWVLSSRTPQFCCGSHIALRSTVYRPVARHTIVKGGKTMEVYLLAVLIGLIPAIIAKGKGRSFGLWWFYGAALFIIALPHSLIMKPNIQAIENQQLSEGMQKCPHCAEFIKADAKVCRYCGRDIRSTP